MEKKKQNKLLLFWYSHPRLAVAFILVFVNLCVIVLFTAILSLISGNPFFDELAYLFTYTMCSDGIYDFVNEQEDVACFIVKIVLTLIQMIIFSGALIGFTTDVLQTTFDNRLENKGKMRLNNHFVFLNWSAIGQNIIYDLSFLEGEKTVVVLAEEEKEEILNSIDNIFTAMKRSKKGLRIFVKKGDPTSSKHLSDISIANAKYVGILLSNAENNGEREISEKDISAFKLALSMIGEAPNANIVVETENEKAKIKIEQVIESSHAEAKHRVSVFSHNSVMGHFIGRTIIDSRFSQLFHNVLSFDGSEFYSIPSMNIEEALLTYNDCIPIVNYDDDDEVDENGNKNPDQLYILSDTQNTLGKRSEKRSFVKPLKYREKIKPLDFTLFIFSNSTRASFVISELENYNNMFNSSIKYKVFDHKEDLSTTVKLIEETKGLKKILLLNEEEDLSHDSQDSTVFLSLLELKQSKIISNEVEICVEIVNVDNLSPIRNLKTSAVILSNKIISLYMLQLLTHVGSRKFFKDVLISNSDEGEVDFEINSADELLEFDSDALEFSCYSEIVQSFYAASNKSRMLVGYFERGDKGDNIVFFCDKMDEPNKIVLKPSDKLITITYGGN